MDGHSGYYLEVRIDGEFVETQFFFPENGYLRQYAYIQAGDPDFTLYPPGSYLVKLEELVHDGDAISVDDAVRNAVRDYVRMRLKRTMEQEQDGEQDQ